MEQMQLIVKNAGVISYRYKEKCWWASREDIRHDAIVAQLHCRSTYDGVRPDVRYMWRAAVLAASSSVKRASSPVSSLKDADFLLGLYRAPLEAGEQDERESQHDLLEQKDLIERIRARVRLLLGDETLTFAIDLLTGEFRPADVAEEHGIPINEVYLCVKKIKNALASDPELYRMWKE